jgi:hypothetical protein
LLPNQDKRIRACFLRFFAELLLHYRDCLELVRLHSRPVIVFHKAAFIGMRAVAHSPVMQTMIDGLLFQAFVAARGLPFRVCDIFDEVHSHLFHDKRAFCKVVANFHEQLKKEDEDRGAIAEHIRFLAEKLAINVGIFFVHCGEGEIRVVGRARGEFRRGANADEDREGRATPRDQPANRKPVLRTHHGIISSCRRIS